MFSHLQLFDELFEEVFRSSSFTLHPNPQKLIGRTVLNFYLKFLPQKSHPKVVNIGNTIKQFT